MDFRPNNSPRPSDKIFNRERMLDVRLKFACIQVAGDNAHRRWAEAAATGWGESGKDWEILPMDFNNPGRG